MLAPQQTIVLTSANFHARALPPTFIFLYFERPIYLAVNAIANSPRKAKSQPRN